MAFTVGDVILAARDMNPAFTPQRHPDPVCRRFLSRYTKTLAGKIAALRPRALAATITTVNVASFDFAAGTTLPAFLLVLEAQLHRSGEPADALVPVDIIPGGDRFGRRQAVPFGWLDNAQFFLGGRAENYARFDTLAIRTFAMPTTAADADVLPFDDDALDACAAQLAAFLGGRVANSPDTEEFDASTLRGDGAEAERVFLDRIGNQRRAEVWRIKRVS